MVPEADVREALFVLKSSISQIETFDHVPVVTRYVLSILHGSGHVALTFAVQVCQFCFNNIKNNMNGLCPACRRPYDEKTIEWKVVTQEEYALPPLQSPATR